MKNILKVIKDEDRKFPICNKKKNTAPCICGKTFILCWRCTMVTISILFFTTFFECISWKFKGNVVFLILGGISLVPMIIDGYITYFTSGSSNNFKRILTGSLFGFGVSLILILTKKF